MCLGRQHRLVQIFEALPPSWEAWVELQAPGLYLAPPRLLWAFEEETSRWERPLPLSLALPFSYSLFFSHFAFQIHCPRFFKSQKKKSYSDFHLTDKDRDQQTTIHNPNPAFHLLVWLKLYCNTGTRIPLCMVHDCFPRNSAQMRNWEWDFLAHGARVTDHLAVYRKACQP